ncbi:helix-turn-helix domain-containing protein [Microtetraspora niveoalba]|uniref:helix-turn-helix domain-containing protein n=1 Tax=Microtetraspora niveoalba TaxID=46175 RepID=UPI0009FD4FA9|nr:helix-turn-helix transcriptional regulator [Microtetraspora niveoalba]
MPHPTTLPFDRKRLREWRERRGYHQSDLAQRCTDQGTPVSVFQVSRAEVGKSKPQAHVVVAMARALQIELDELLSTPVDENQEQESP